MSSPPPPPRKSQKLLEEYKQSKKFVRDIVTEMLRNKDNQMVRSMVANSRHREILENRIQKLGINLRDTKSVLKVAKAETKEYSETVDVLNRAVLHNSYKHPISKDLQNELMHRAQISINIGEDQGQELEQLATNVTTLEQKLELSQRNEKVLERDIAGLRHALELVLSKAENTLEQKGKEAVEELVTEANQDLKKIEELQGDPHLQRLAEERQRQLAEMSAVKKQIEKLQSDKKTLEAALRKAEQEVVQMRLKMMERDSSMATVSKKIKAAEAKLHEEQSTSNSRIEAAEKMAGELTQKYEAELKKVRDALDEATKKLNEQNKQVEYFKSQVSEAKFEMVRIRKNLEKERVEMQADLTKKLGEEKKRADDWEKKYHNDIAAYSDKAAVAQNTLFTTTQELESTSQKLKDVETVISELQKDLLAKDEEIIAAKKIQSSGNREAGNAAEALAAAFVRIEEMESDHAELKRDYEERNTALEDDLSSALARVAELQKSLKEKDSQPDNKLLAAGPKSDKTPSKKKPAKTPNEKSLAPRKDVKSPVEEFSLEAPRVAPTPSSTTEPPIVVIEQQPQESLTSPMPSNLQEPTSSSPVPLNTSATPVATPTSRSPIDRDIVGKSSTDMQLEAAAPNASQLSPRSLKLLDTDRFVEDIHDSVTEVTPITIIERRISEVCNRISSITSWRSVHPKARDPGAITKSDKSISDLSNVIVTITEIASIARKHTAELDEEKCQKLALKVDELALENSVLKEEIENLRESLSQSAAAIERATKNENTTHVVVQQVQPKLDSVTHLSSSDLPETNIIERVVATPPSPQHNALQSPPSRGEMKDGQQETVSQVIVREEETAPPCSATPVHAQEQSLQEQVEQKERSVRNETLSAPEKAEVEKAEATALPKRSSSHGSFVKRSSPVPTGEKKVSTFSMELDSKAAVPLKATASFSKKVTAATSHDAKQKDSAQIKSLKEQSKGSRGNSFSLEHAPSSHSNTPTALSARTMEESKTATPQSAALESIQQTKLSLESEAQNEKFVTQAATQTSPLNVEPVEPVVVEAPKPECRDSSVQSDVLQSKDRAIQADLTASSKAISAKPTRGGPQHRSPKPQILTHLPVALNQPSANSQQATPLNTHLTPNETPAKLSVTPRSSRSDIPSEGVRSARSEAAQSTVTVQSTASAQSSEPENREISHRGKSNKTLKRQKMMKELMENLGPAASPALSAIQEEASAISTSSKSNVTQEQLQLLVVISTIEKCERNSMMVAAEQMMWEILQVFRASLLELHINESDSKYTKAASCAEHQAKAVKEFILARQRAEEERLRCHKLELVSLRTALTLLKSGGVQGAGETKQKSKKFVKELDDVQNKVQKLLQSTGMEIIDENLTLSVPTKKYNDAIRQFKELVHDHESQKVMQKMHEAMHENTRQKLDDTSLELNRVKAKLEVSLMQGEKRTTRLESLTSFSNSIQDEKQHGKPPGALASALASSEVATIDTAGETSPQNKRSERDAQRLQQHLSALYRTVGMFVSAAQKILPDEEGASSSQSTHHAISVDEVNDRLRSVLVNLKQVKKKISLSEGKPVSFIDEKQFSGMSAQMSTSLGVEVLKQLVSPKSTGGNPLDDSSKASSPTAASQPLISVQANSVSLPSTPALGSLSPLALQHPPPAPKSGPEASPSNSEPLIPTDLTAAPMVSELADSTQDHEANMVTISAPEHKRGGSANSYQSSSLSAYGANDSDDDEREGLHSPAANAGQRHVAIDVQTDLLDVEAATAAQKFIGGIEVENAEVREHLAQLVVAFSKNQSELNGYKAAEATKHLRPPSGLLMPGSQRASDWAQAQFEDSLQPLMTKVQAQLMKHRLGELMNDDMRSSFLTQLNSKLHSPAKASTAADALVQTRSSALQAVIGHMNQNVANASDEINMLNVMFRSFPTGSVEELSYTYDPEVAVELVSDLSKWWEKWAKESQAVQQNLLSNKQDSLKQMLQLCDMLENVAGMVNTEYADIVAGEINQRRTNSQQTKQLLSVANYLQHRGNVKKNKMLEQTNPEKNKKEKTKVKRATSSSATSNRNSSESFQLRSRCTVKDVPTIDPAVSQRVDAKLNEIKRANLGGNRDFASTLPLRQNESAFVVRPHKVSGPPMPTVATMGTVSTTAKHATQSRATKPPRESLGRHLSSLEKEDANESWKSSTMPLPPVRGRK